jgi:hypothetical protein
LIQADRSNLFAILSDPLVSEPVDLISFVTSNGACSGRA